LGDVVPLTLVWRSLGDLSEHWDVLVHLVDDQGEIVAQGDGPPVGGFRPTASWRAGEVLVDERQLILPADLAPGSYTVWTGLYWPGSWERLPAFVSGERQPEDRLLLGTLVVEATDD
jgi:mannosyltransferase